MNNALWGFVVLTVLFSAFVIGVYFGQQSLVTVPRFAADEALIIESEKPLMVNINTASSEELEKLPGIGPVLADAIIDYRAQHGAFAAIEDIMLVSGIKNALFDSIKGNITIE